MAVVLRKRNPALRFVRSENNYSKTKTKTENQYTNNSLLGHSYDSCLLFFVFRTQITTYAQVDVNIQLSTRSHVVRTPGYLLASGIFKKT